MYLQHQCESLETCQQLLFATDLRHVEHCCKGMEHISGHLFHLPGIVYPNTTSTKLMTIVEIDVDGLVLFNGFLANRF